jgi:hypothetical protein
MSPAPEKKAHLFGHRRFHGGDKIGALVVKYLCLGKRLDRLMLGVASGRIHNRQHAHQGRSRHLRRDQVDALLLTPAGIVDGLSDPVYRLVSRWLRFVLALELATHRLPGDGACKGRCLAAQQIGHHAGAQPLAANLDVDFGAIGNAAVDQGQGDGAAAAPIGEPAVEPLAVEKPHRHHGAAGDKPGRLPVVEHRCSCPGDALVDEGNAAHPAGKGINRSAALRDDGLKGVKLGFQCRSTDIVFFVRREADRETGQGNGKNGNRGAFGIDAQLVAVKREPRLQAEGIPGAQPDGHRASGLHGIPDGNGAVRRHEHLETQRLSCVTGACQPEPMALHGGNTETIAPGLGQGLLSHQLGKDGFGLGSLKADHGDFGGPVFQLNTFKMRQFVLQMSPVFLSIGCIDHQQVAILEESVEVGIVHGTAGLIGNQGILTLAHVKCPGVVGEHVLQKIKCAGSGDDEPAHVGYVEKSGCAPCRQVLFENTVWILDRHIPAAEIHHLCAQFDMARIKYGA